RMPRSWSRTSSRSGSSSWLLAAPQTIGAWIAGIVRGLSTPPVAHGATTSAGAPRMGSSPRSTILTSRSSPGKTAGRARRRGAEAGRGGGAGGAEAGADHLGASLVAKESEQRLADVAEPLHRHGLAGQGAASEMGQRRFHAADHAARGRDRRIAAAAERRGDA